MNKFAPPIAPKEPFVHEMHGHRREDPYHWMRLTEEQRLADPPDAHTQKVLAHLKAENAHTEAVLSARNGLRDSLFAEMKGRIKEDDSSVPYRENGYWYHLRYEEGKEYPMHYRRKDAEGAEEELIIDENALADGLDYFELSDYEVAPNNRWMAFGTDTVGRRVHEIRFKDLETGEFLPDRLQRTDGSCAWADDSTVYYVVKDDTLRDFKVMRHILGTPSTDDVEVFHEKDEGFRCDVYRCRSDRFVIISSESTLSSEHWLLPTTDPHGTFKVFLPREKEHEHSIFNYPGGFYVLTNWQAPNFRLMQCSEEATLDKSRWKEVVPHRKDVHLEDVDLFKDHIVLSERERGLIALRVRRISDGREHLIAFNDPVYVAATGTNPEWDSDKLRYGYGSLTTPNSVMEHDLNSGEDRMLKQQEVLGPFDPSWYRSARCWATAPDGKQVPISIVHHKDTPIDGTAPALLYGYGSYGITVEPRFSSARLSLLDRGMVFAIAHVRGGEMLGRPWYEEGRMEHKMNTFTDFIAAAEFLKANGYTDPGCLIAMGGSAGGLLVGAVMNLRPDLWKAVVAAVPFVDVVTTMLDESIPLTTGEFNEWGDPKEKEAYLRMLSYSPYDNVRDAHYPAMLVTTGLHDSQVQYWEPAKWVARLREHQLSDAPILLYTNLDAGHGGASGRFERLKEVALEYAFILWQAGKDGTS